MSGLKTALAELSPDPGIIGRANEGELLSWCDQGLRALEKAVKLDDAKNVLDLAATLNYAVRVRDMNQEAVIAASKLRIMAERRVGELIASERQAERLASNGGDRRGHLRAVSLTDEETDLPTLADHGITYNEAAAYVKLAAVPAAQFEAVLDEAAADATKRRVGIARSTILRAIDPEGEKRPDERAEDFEKFIDDCAKASRRYDSALTALRWGAVTKDHPWPEATINHARRTLTTLAASLAEILKEIDR